MQAFCQAKGIKPRPASFLYCPDDVVEFVYASLLERGMSDEKARSVVGERLWLTRQDYLDWCAKCAEGICEHGKDRYYCVQCEGAGICEHGIQKRY
jgi:hypothetical protein